MRTFSWPSFATAPWNFAFATVLFLCATASIMSAQTLTTLVTFNGPNGANPRSPLIQGTDGNLYGTTQGGGTVNQGTIFKVTPSGTFTLLYSFDGLDGSIPSGVIQATDGNFYGTSQTTVFKVTSSGTLTTIYTFCSQLGCADGDAPAGGLARGTDGNFYGTTTQGGQFLFGTVFKITPAGALTTLYNFCSQNDCSDGTYPNAPMVQGMDGNFYGTTFSGGADNSGTIFKITPSGIFTTLYSFCSQPNCPDGFAPTGALIQATDGSFYGTTQGGGGANGNGIVYRITPSGSFTVLYRFCSQNNCADGSEPWGGLIQATDGSLYGTTTAGGLYNFGLIFKITTQGLLNTIYNFCALPNCTDGAAPDTGLLQASDGNFYGTTSILGGGTGGSGTVFRLSGPSANDAQFVPATPCRLVDTRETHPIEGGTWQIFIVPQLGACDIPATATAYSLNVTVVPQRRLGYLTIWPTGESQPAVSTLNSPDGRTKANAAIVPAGANGAVSVYVTDTSDVILDIDGYFTAPTQGSLQFYPLTPCRVVDTRNGSNQPQGLGPPSFGAMETRELPVLSKSPCLRNLPNQPLAYSLNVTASPNPAGQPLSYLTVWPSDEPQPTVSTLNNPTATVVANAAIVPAAANGDISAYARNSTDVIMDINGYFAVAGQNGLSFYPTPPCRAYDSRSNNGQPFHGERTVNIVDSQCAQAGNAQAYVFNATVVPGGPLGYLTLWPDSEPQPIVSTLNAQDGFVTSNMAIVPNINGSIDAYASALTQLILDISGYFAP